jgi:two-component system probable response regulator PhcQ
MNPAKILYVDDEAMALKYFERLISPVAPVLTADSVAAGKALLEAHGDEIAVLVSDQRMPGAQGNELLKFAREHFPNMVRMLTTAYSELDDAIEAINAGEIYRYVTKPWNSDTLRADLRNALELFQLRHERTALLDAKLLMQQRQLLGFRIAQLAGLAGDSETANVGLSRYLRWASLGPGQGANIDWNRIDFPELIQNEARRGQLIARCLAARTKEWPEHATAAVALELLAAACDLPLNNEQLRVTDPGLFSGLLHAESPTPAQMAWFSWLLWMQTQVDVQPTGDGWVISASGQVATPPGHPQWLAAAVERLLDI